MLKPRAVLDLLLHVVPRGHPRRPCRLNFPVEENKRAGPGALSWNPDLVHLTPMLVPMLGRVGASVTQEAAPWTRIFIGLVVNRWRCRANETVKALGYIVYIFS